MKKIFICSLCRGGILGGALYLDEAAIFEYAFKLGMQIAIETLTDTN